MSPSISRDVPCRVDDDAEPIPVVFVEGFMGRGTSEYWGDVDQYNRPRRPCQREPAQKRRLLFVHLGSVSSLHDRACELYYQIMGGTVDYGEQHSKTHRHGRYGRSYEGLYPQWSGEHPLHFVGHSYGGVTIWYMQQLLIRGYFSAPAGARRDVVGRYPAVSEGHAAAEGAEFVGGKNAGDWVRSLTGISAPFRGTPAAYILGEKEDEPAKVHPLSFGSALYRLVHLYLYADLPEWIKAYLYDFNVDHWGFSRNGNAETGKSSFSELLSHLACSKWAEGRDCAPYDLTLRRMAWVNRRSALCEKTYYQSFAASMTEEDSESGFHLPMIHGVLPLTVLSYFVGRFSLSSQKLMDEVSGAAEYSSDDCEAHWQRSVEAACAGTRPVHLPPGRRYDPSEWWENDGVCPLASQLHPGACAEGYCTCCSGGGGERTAPPGVWSTHVLPSTSHVDVVPNVRGLLRRPAPRRAPEAAAAAVGEEATGVFWRVMSALAASLFQPTATASSAAAGAAPRTRVRRDSGFASSDEVDAVCEPSGPSSKHARVFRHFFGWLDAIDEAEERRAGRRQSNAAGRCCCCCWTLAARDAPHLGTCALRRKTRS